MDNQFTFKDGILIALLAILVGISGLHMIMVDRQQDKLDKILAKLDNNANAGMGGRIFTTGPATDAGEDWRNEKLFAPIVEAMKKPDFRFGGTFVDNFPTKMGKLTPLVGGDVYQQEVEYRVMESLATRDVNTLEFIPMLAKSWKISNDGLRIDFKLREGVRFSDGKPFTSDDVIFTFDWILNPKVEASRARSYMDKFDKYFASGPYDVTFTFKEPYYKSFETVATISIMSKAFYSKFSPTDFNDSTGLLIGTGQYRLPDPRTWTPGEKIELVRNEYYWGPRGIYDRLEFKEIENEAAEIVMFGNGEIDRIAVVPKDYENLLKKPEILKMSQHLEYRSLLGGYSYIGWNQQRDGKPTIFADKRVRQAMTYLLDRDKIAKTTLKGYSTVANGPFHPDSEQSDPTIKPCPFDEAKGKALLAEAGFRDTNGDGIVEGPDGKPFSFELTYSSGSATMDNIVLAMRDNYARGGINLIPKPVAFAVLLKILKQSDFEACCLAWGGDIESDAYQIFHSSQTEGDADNRTHYINKDLDDAIMAARRTIDEKTRMERWHKVHQIIADDQPYTFLFNSKSLVFINNRVGNVKTSKLGTNYVLLNAMPIPFYSVPGK